MRIVQAGPDAFALRLPEILRLYAAEYRLGPEAARERAAIMRRHLGRKRFAAFFALEGDDLLGFAYGYAGGPGEYWYNLVHRGMPPPLREEWLGEHFEFVELLVAPAARGRGLGGRLHDRLLAGRSRWRSSPCGQTTTPRSRCIGLGAGGSCSRTSALPREASGFS